MWAEALDVMMARVADALGPDRRRLAAIGGSAQQHGSVYLNRDAGARLEALDPSKTLTAQVPAMLSRPTSPIWMDSSTSVECREIAAAVGGDAVLGARTGSRAFERFTGPQIRKVFKRERQAYLSTGQIHLVSSFLASLLAGCHAPLDPCDASGMNLMDIADREWWPPALEATAPNLLGKLPAIAPSWTVAGRLAPFWQTRCRLPPARVVVWSGDNPCSLIGTGLVREGLVAVSLGTSDTIFGLVRRPRIDPSGTGHLFSAPTGDYMSMTVFKNGSLARQRVRDAYGLSWEAFARLLQEAPAGNRGRILLPWYEPEITPFVAAAGERRYGLVPADVPANVRAIVEAQMMSMALHSRWMDVEVAAMYATGGAAVNRAILQVMADVFGADVFRLEVGHSAALGAALRACHADARADGRDLPWDEVISGFVEPVRDSRVPPDPARHAMYKELMNVYAACEAHALGRGPDPAPLVASFRRKFEGAG
jgi:xylulokinase